MFKKAQDFGMSFLMKFILVLVISGALLSFIVYSLYDKILKP